MGTRRSGALAPCPSAGVLPARGQVRVVGVLPDPGPGPRGAPGGAQGHLGPAVHRGRRRPRARFPVHRYSFPEQEVAFDEGDDLYEIGDEKLSERYSAIDLSARTLEIAKSAGPSELHPAAVMVNERVPPQPVDSAFLLLRESPSPESGWMATDRIGRHATCSWRGGRGFRAPAGGPLRRPGEDMVDAAIRLAKSLDNGILPIQGPPGSGKTFTGARMIVSLAREGKRIGVTAVSHKVIQNLLSGSAAGSGGCTEYPSRPSTRTARRAVMQPTASSVWTTTPRLARAWMRAKWLAVRPGSGPARTWRSPWTTSSSTRRGRCPWRTRSPRLDPRPTSSSWGTPSSWSSRKGAPIRRVRKLQPSFTCWEAAGQ